MRLIVVMAVVTASTSVCAADAPRHIKPAKLALFCTKFGDKSSGLTKICYYDCGGSEGATTVKVYDQCARWTPRWRLNRSIQFGPRETSR